MATLRLKNGIAIGLPKGSFGECRELITDSAAAELFLSREYCIPHTPDHRRNIRVAFMAKVLRMRPRGVTTAAECRGVISTYGNNAVKDLERQEHKVLLDFYNYINEIALQC